MFYELSSYKHDTVIYVFTMSCAWIISMIIKFDNVIKKSSKDQNETSLS